MERLDILPPSKVDHNKYAHHIEQSFLPKSRPVSKSSAVDLKLELRNKIRWRFFARKVDEYCNVNHLKYVDLFIDSLPNDKKEFYTLWLFTK